MADIVLNVTVKDAYVLRLLEAVKSRFIKEGTETNKQFVERILRDYLKDMVHNYELRKDQERYNAEISAIAQPKTNIPVDLVE